jgi:hypothetical protein
VYDLLVNNVPTKNIPILIEKYTKRLGITVEKVPHRSTVELMARELGISFFLSFSWSSIN